MNSIKSVSIQIGNSDNKLSQKSWHLFVSCMQELIDTIRLDQHFFGGPANWEPWQNVCWMFTIFENNIPEMNRRVKKLREEYQQDSVAVMIGHTEFV